MRYAASRSNDYLGPGTIVIRDFNSEPKGRVFAIIPRDNPIEAQQIAQEICDLLNKKESNK